MLLERRKQFQRQLRLLEKEEATARAISAEAREAYQQRKLASRRLKIAAEEQEARRCTRQNVASEHFCWRCPWRGTTHGRTPQNTATERQRMGTTDGRWWCAWHGTMNNRQWCPSMVRR